MSDSKKELDAVITNISSEGTQCYVHLSVDYKGETLQLKQPIGIDEVHKLLPNIIIGNNGDVYLGNEYSQPILFVDTKSDLAKLLLGDIGLIQADAARQRRIEINSIVPAELRNKYCLIFGGRVWYSADTLEELEKKRAESPNILFTTYIPSNHQ